jgi:hypothetical protein
MCTHELEVRVVTDVQYKCILLLVSKGPVVFGRSR